MDSPNPPSMRVLTRPPASPVPTSFPNPPPPLPPSSPSFPRSLDGVVVVGFLSRRPDDSCQLINRVIDSNVFGSGQVDRVLSLDKDELEDWFKFRKISYYHEEDKGILFLQFSSNGCPFFDGSLCSGSDFNLILDEREFGDLQGLLFMFSVCHIIIYIQEGSCFGTQNLKRFRVLQAAKHALIPYIKSRTAPPLPSRPDSSSSSHTSPGRSGGMLGRNASTISLMLGLGSYTSLFPGQCTPVMLFVFLDDFYDVPNSSANNTEDSVRASSLNHASSSSSLAKPTLPVKGGASVVVLARPASKAEGGFRKKLQSSLEAQIRFLIKKCRTLSGSEGSHSGSRSGSVSNAAPLFSLDASRAVVLLDKLTNKRGESLELATGLVEDVLNGKASSDSFLLEAHSQSSNKEDLSSLKEFIYRQSDILRGRGGSVANSSAAAGVGMVAVAAAAAAASTASAKTLTTPELPTLDIWLSSSQLILHGLLSAKRGCIDETEIGKRKPRRSTIAGLSEGVASRSSESLDIVVSWLESGKGLNTKFSSLWCERALPAAKDIYLKDLPACYPTSQHEAHLEKALLAFHSMVRGHAVELFAKMLEEECTSMWKSGRQLCDAVSLTGKPCLHQRHDVETGELPSGTLTKPHSSGYVFLHACACGRTRRLRSDPFDYESANITSNCFPDCDKLLSALQLPEVSSKEPIQPSWSLIRVGSARYYGPSKGLLQSGFSTTEKFLLKWKILLEQQKTPNGLSARTMQLGSVCRSCRDPTAEFNADIQLKKASSTELSSGETESAVEIPRKPLEISKLNGNKISFGRGLLNFTMKKPFSEVVAGSAATNSGFPPLQQRKQPLTGSEKGVKKNKASALSSEGAHSTVDQGSQKLVQMPSFTSSLQQVSSDDSAYRDPILRIGSNFVPVNVSNDKKAKPNSDMKHVMAYVGFEHECPHGHRFLLNQEHLNQLGPPYSLLEESHIASSVEASDYTSADSSKVGRNGEQGKFHRNTNGIIATAAPINMVKNKDGEKKVLVNSKVFKDRVTQLSMYEDHNQTSVSTAGVTVAVKDLENGFQSVSLDDGGSDISMLNRDLPIYLKCPHCRSARNNKEPPKFKFASTISQLQRIFLVTPPFPVVLATCPVIQFKASCLPSSVPDSEQKLQFSLGSKVILPPESFIILRLPFIYGVQLDDKRVHALNPFEDKPEVTGCIVRGTTFQLMSKGTGSNE